VADIQDWLDGTLPNDGWIIIGTETGTTARAVSTAESATSPRLVISYTTSGSPVTSWPLYR
jgi:hypothetical protein